MSIQDRINRYWSMRAVEFGDETMEERTLPAFEAWQKEIVSRLPEQETIKALDLGCGPGFAAMILREAGCAVTGIDYAEKMAEVAAETAAKCGLDDIEFLCMDAQDMGFADETFDFIFTRNVIWTLPDPAKAYREMVRVLKPGGRIMNCDARYNRVFRRTDAEGTTMNAASDKNKDKYEHPSDSPEMLRERNDYAKNLPAADYERPHWDAAYLQELGMIVKELDESFGPRVIQKRPVTAEGNHDADMFMILAEKPRG